VIGETRLARLRDERADRRRARLDVADAGIGGARQEQLARILAAPGIVDIVRRAVLDDMLVVGRHPPDPAEIDAVLAVEDAAQPETRGDRVAAVDDDAPP